MPSLILTRGAALDLEDRRLFLAEKNPDAAARASQVIMAALMRLRTAPDIGRPHPRFPQLRELLISFGGSGYIALYRHETERDRVRVLAIRHMKEARYRGGLR